MTNEEKLKALEALRGEHDQTIRCGVIRILYEPLATAKRNETNTFLEAEIAALKGRMSE